MTGGCYGLEGKSMEYLNVEFVVCGSFHERGWSLTWPRMREKEEFFNVLVTWYVLEHLV